MLTGLDWFPIRSIEECFKKRGTRNFVFHRRKLFLDQVRECHILRENFTLNFFTEKQIKNIRTYSVLRQNRATRLEMSTMKDTGCRNERL